MSGPGLIVDKDELVILDRIAWGRDTPRLWRYWVIDEREEWLDIARGGFWLLAYSDREHVVLIQRSEDDTHTFTIRPITRIDEVKARATHHLAKWSFDGSPALWAVVPPYALVWSEEHLHTVMLHLDPDDPDPDPLAWHNAGTYDTMYQGLVGVNVVPGGRLVIVSVQRDSRPVLYDPAERKVVGHIELAGRHGNPSFIFRRTADEVWADDYDTLLRLRPNSW